MRPTPTPRLAAALLASLLLPAAAPDAAADDALRERFLAEYPEANARLREFYTHARMVIDSKQPMTKVDRDQQPPTIELVGWRESDKTISTNGDLIRSDVVVDGATYSLVVGADRAFKASRDLETKQYTITVSSDRSPAELDDWVDEVQNSIPAAFIPFRIGSYSIEEYTEGDGSEIVAVEEVERDGTRMVRVDWTRPLTETESRPEVTQRGSFFFLPESSWALARFEISGDYRHPETGAPIRSGEYCDIEYEGERDGVPLLKGMTHWRGTPDYTPPKETSEVKSITPVAVPEEAFTPAAFGIEEEPAP